MTQKQWFEAEFIKLVRVRTSSNAGTGNPDYRIVCSKSAFQILLNFIYKVVSETRFKTIEECKNTAKNQFVYSSNELEIRDKIILAIEKLK